MQKVLICLLIILLPFISFAQSPEDDEITFRSAVDWLDRKLNYIYFDGVAQKWWLNKFYVNENKDVTVKNIFTNKPRSANIKEKVYLIRTFKFQDINPYQISIRKIATDQGRVVKGKLLELRTFANKKNVHKTVNGRRGSDVSFVQISFPTFMTDSIADYAELVQVKLREAIIASTKVYATNNFEENKKLIFSIINGSFRSEDDESMIASKKFKNVISLEINKDEENYFGFNQSNNLFYLTTISDEGVITKDYQLLEGNKLLLQNPKKKSEIIEFETLNSIRINGKAYYRE